MIITKEHIAALRQAVEESMGQQPLTPKDFDLPNKHTLGTFRTYTLKIEGSDIVVKNIPIENNAARLGQAVALHTEGDRLTFINCRFLGIKIPSIQALPTRAFTSKTATSREPRTSSSARQ